MAVSLWIIVSVLFTIYTVSVSGAGTEQTREICNQASWCGDCIQARPECAWCNDENFAGTRCNTRDELSSCTDVIFFETAIKAVDNRTLQDGSGARDPVQLQPQHIKIKLKVGEPYSFSMKYQVAENLPIDMYFVLDFTETMRNRLQKLANLTQQLIFGLERRFTKNIVIGYGSFVDKVLQPFTLTTEKKLENPCGQAICDRPYGFIHRSSLNNNYQHFSDSIKFANTSSNFDQMEGGLDAILQAALCPNIIGWRNQSRRIMVYISDGGYHFAGDARLAGVDKPNDGACHLKPIGDKGEYIYEASKTQDYPSLAQLASVIKDNNINTYFLVNEQYQKMYSDLTDMSVQLATNTFKTGSAQSGNEASNIVSQIIEAYVKLTRTITIGADKIPGELDVSVASNCGTGGVINTKDLNLDPFVCTEVGALVDFNVTITAKSCPADKKPQRFVITPQGLQERLVIEVDYYCDCDCQSSEAVNFEKCTEGNGTYECGVCRCDEGRSGEWCQCDNRNNDQASNKQMNNQCKINNDTDIQCSNKGECDCGQCSCFKNHFGKYCECDYKMCQRPGDDRLCSGVGKCTCNGCDCSLTDGLHGDFCECPKENCTGKNGICNGRGDCVCGRCQCLDYYKGEQCQECKTQYQAKCEKCVKCGKNECVKCLEENASPDGGVPSICQQDCSAVNITKVDKFGKDENPCPVLDKENCEISYIVTCDDFGHYLQVAKTKFCVNPPDALWIALPLLFGIFGVGILMILIWKILTSFYDKIEYAKFEHEIQNPKWSQTENPIYKTATTTNQNPMYHGDAE